MLGERADLDVLHHKQIIRGRAVDTGPLAARCLEVVRPLNEVRQPEEAKRPWVVWDLPHAACTVPGPNVYIARGVADRIEHDDALAFVLAHEMAHHDLGHTGGVLGRIPAGMAMAAAVQNLKRLTFGPRLELDADARALEICLEAGFDRGRCLLALEMFLADDEPPRWFAMHPPIQERLDALAA